MSLYEALGISVAAGFFVVLFMAICRVLWNWVFENIYLKITCRYLSDISGLWTSEYTDIHGHKCYDEMIIRQYGYRIKGRINYKIQYKDNIREKHKTFELLGLLRNDTLSAYYWNIDRKQKGCGSFTLALSKEGDQFEGASSWYDVEGNKIIHGDYELKKKA